MIFTIFRLLFRTNELGLDSILDLLFIILAIT